MTYLLKIKRYSSTTGDTVEIEHQIPGRVTITGKEDHWARACEDVDQFIAGMRELDRALGNDKATRGDKIVDAPVHYYVVSLGTF